MRTTIIAIITAAAVLFSVPAAAAEKSNRNQNIGVGSGVIIGAIAGGPVGAIIGAAIGAKVGDEFDDKNVQIASLESNVDNSNSQVARLERDVDAMGAELDRLNRCVARIRHMTVSPADAITQRPSPVASANRFVEDKGLTIVCDTTESDVVHRTLAGSRHTIESCLGQRTQHHVHDTLAGLNVGYCDSRWKVRV